MEESDKGRGEQRGSAPLGGEGGAARPVSWVCTNGRKYHRWSTYEEKRKAVRLFLEEGMPSEVVAAEVGVTHGTVFDWVRQYRENGEAGLRPKRHGFPPGRKPDAVGEKITSLKKNNPHFGAKRISQILRRLFLLKASPETVRRRLKKAGLGTKAKKARKRPKAKIHFFERTAPNETWQSDITQFRLLGHEAYIVGFIDDYSRYITGLGVFRTHTAERVLDVYRTAVADYGTPKEMLTDNGRQYANWRGMTRFQKALKQDKVHHIRSASHHPQTLGKIERFWKTIKEEFLERARFETFEEAQERIKYWIKFYNHKRPHSSLKGLCPAERYFSVQKEIGEAIRKGVEENVESLALRGIPSKPFYMVGQMGDQSVVMRTEKGKLKVLLGEGREMVYDLKENMNEDGRDNNGTEKTGVEGVQREGEMPGSIGGMVGQKDAKLAVPGAEHELGVDQRVGEAGAGRDDEGAGSGLEQDTGGRDPAGKADRRADREDRAGGTAAGSASELKESGDEDRNAGEELESGREVPGSAGDMDGADESGGGEPGDGDKRKSLDTVAGPGDGRDAGRIGTAAAEGEVSLSCAGEHGKETAGQEGAVEGNGGEIEAGEESDETGGEKRHTGVKESNGSGNGETSTGSPGAGRPDEGHGGGGEDGGEPQDVLQVGEKGALGDEGVAHGEGLGAAGSGGGYGERGAEAGDRGTEEGSALVGAEASHP